MTTLNAMTCELETARKLFWLLKQDYIFFSGWNEDTQDQDTGAYPAINCNDLFVPGADAEQLAEEDLDLYIEVMKRYPKYGSAAWCAARHNRSLWRQTGNRDWIRGYNEAVEGVKIMLAIDKENQNV